MKLADDIILHGEYIPSWLGTRSECFLSTFGKQFVIELAYATGSKNK